MGEATLVDRHYNKFQDSREHEGTDGSEQDGGALDEGAEKALG